MSNSTTEAGSQSNSPSPVFTGVEPSAQTTSPPFSTAIWSTDFDDEVPGTIPGWLKDWLEAVKADRSGVVILRDAPFDKGIDAFPRPLSIPLVEAGNVFILINNVEVLPLRELREQDEDLACSVSLKMRENPGIRQLIVFCSTEQAQTWRAFIKHYNPGAWIGVISNSHGRLVDVGDMATLQRYGRRASDRYDLPT